MCEGIRPAPYPATTNAKGWRFELDYERIRRSDTWALAPPAMRPWLLMLWMAAWEQVPCGSLPADDELIAARIGMPLDEFAAVRRLLMRGWWRAEDGRLYHDTVAERVLEMLGAKERERLRKADYRRRLAGGHGDGADVPRDKHGTPKGLHPESATGTGTSTSTKEEDIPPTPRKRGAAAQVWITRLADLGVHRQHAQDWLKIRAGKRLVLTDTALETLQAEAAKTGMTVAQAVERACQEGWGGFKAKWVLEPKDGRGGSEASSAWWDSQKGIMDKGLELGLPGPSELSGVPFLRYTASVWLAAGDGPWIDERSTAYQFYVRLRNGEA